MQAARKITDEQHQARMLRRHRKRASLAPGWGKRPAGFAPPPKPVPLWGKHVLVLGKRWVGNSEKEVRYHFTKGYRVVMP